MIALGVFSLVLSAVVAQTPVDQIPIPDVTVASKGPQSNEITVRLPYTADFCLVAFHLSFGTISVPNVGEINSNDIKTATGSFFEATLSINNPQLPLAGKVLNYWTRVEKKEASGCMGYNSGVRKATIT